MRYYWQFDLCALAVGLLVLLETLRRKDLKQRKNKWFLAIVLAIIVSSIADLPGIYMQNVPEKFHLFTADISTMIFLTVRNMLPWLYACYVGSLLKLSLNVKKWVMGFVMAPEILMILWMLIEPTRRFVYYYENNITYHRGPLFNVFYFLTAYYVIIGVFMMIRYRKALNKREKLAFYTFTVLSLVPVVIQAFFPELKWALFFQSIGLLGAFLTIDNEDAIRSPESGFYNRYALIHDAGRLFDIGINAYVLLIKSPSIQSVAVAIGRDAEKCISRDMGEFIEKLIPSGWSMYEYGANQFAVIAYNASDMQAGEIVSSLKDRFSREWSYKNGSLRLPTEIMVGKIPEKAENLEQLVMVMDTPYHPESAEALVIYFDEPTKRQNEAEVEISLRTALQEGRFSVHYQPIYDSRRNSIHSAEALARLKDPNLGMIPPDVFIPIAERNGLMGVIGDFVFEDACRFMARHQNDGCGITMVEVNLSAVQCVDQKLPKRWDDIMSRYGVKPEQFCLELTESAIASSPFTMSVVTDSLRERGFSFALDDYGTGYANNAYIMEFPFEIIKIDKSLLWGADKNEKTDKLLRHIISMIHDLGLELVVEGVETPEQRQKLEQAHVEYLQGFLFSKPLPEESIVSFFAERGHSF